jgi:hypothetical protein
VSNDSTQNSAGLNFAGIQTLSSNGLMDAKAMWFWRFSVALVIPLSLLGAKSGSDVTFSSDVARILFRPCASWHHPDDIAPMSLFTYKEARPWAAAIREAILTRKMPPWKADAQYGKWSNNPSLSQAEIETVKLWAEGGASSAETGRFRA